MWFVVDVEERSVSSKLDLFTEGIEFSVWGGFGGDDSVTGMDADHCFPRELLVSLCL